jgi:hypothetical protein
MEANAPPITYENHRFQKALQPSRVTATDCLWNSWIEFVNVVFIQYTETYTRMPDSYCAGHLFMQICKTNLVMNEIKILVGERSPSSTNKAEVMISNRLILMHSFLLLPS